MTFVLRTHPASPFGRKARLAAIHLGFGDRLEIVETDTRDAADPLRLDNPLGKIPTLILEDGTSLFDSRVILEYLDALAGGGRILPAAGDARWQALRLQALADGVMDAAILQIYERRFRPEHLWHAEWVDYQAGKVARALAHLESQPLGAPGDITVGDIALACALGYLDFRFGEGWRAVQPALSAWVDAFAAAVPAYDQTRPPPA